MGICGIMNSGPTSEWSHGVMLMLHKPAPVIIRVAVDMWSPACVQIVATLHANAGINVTVYSAIMQEERGFDSMRKSKSACVI
uniref:Thioredoxin-like_fold domain-containing protein n=1 Tax=Ascaris lumbricoides TaxID=6252 RepID=A0A0M3I013_ASCLU